MRERDLMLLRARTIARCYGYEDFRHLKGRQRIAYRYMLHALRLLSAWHKKYGKL